jgi:hypothetical protein
MRTTVVAFAAISLFSATATAFGEEVRYANAAVFYLTNGSKTGPEAAGGALLLPGEERDVPLQSMASSWAPPDMQCKASEDLDRKHVTVSCKGKSRSCLAQADIGADGLGEAHDLHCGSAELTLAVKPLFVPKQ